MVTVAAPQKRVRIEGQVPLEVREWLDAKAAKVYKSRGGYLADLLIAAYRKDTGQ